MGSAILLTLRILKIGLLVTWLMWLPYIIKMCNKQMDGVGLVDKRTSIHNLDSKSLIPFIFCIFFNLINVACFESLLVYKMIHSNRLNLLDFETIVLKILLPVRAKKLVHLSYRFSAWLQKMFSLLHVFTVTKKALIVLHEPNIVISYA